MEKEKGLKRKSYNKKEKEKPTESNKQKMNEREGER